MNEITLSMYTFVSVSQKAVQNNKFCTALTLNSGLDGSNTIKGGNRETKGDKGTRGGGRTGYGKREVLIPLPLPLPPPPSIYCRTIWKILKLKEPLSRSD